MSDLIYITEGATAAPILASIKAEADDAFARRQAWLAAFDSAYPIDRAEPRRFASNDRGEIVVVEALADEKPPVGMKYVSPRDVGGWVYKAHTKAGRTIQTEWDALRHRTLIDACRDLGMQTFMFAGHKAYHAGITVKDDTALVVTWSSRAVADDVTRGLEQTGHAGDWAEWKRSEYYAWVEARETAGVNA